MNGMRINLVIDGTNEDGETTDTDVDRAPFYVFDVDAQANISGALDTKLEAAWMITVISVGRIRAFMQSVKSATPGDM